MKLTLQQLEAHLWGAANILRGKTAGQDYKNYILSLMFYKRLCDQWECEADDAIAEQEQQQCRAFTESQKAVFRMRGEHRFSIPDGARWGDVKAASTNLGEVLTTAMKAVASANDELRGVFTVDWNQPAPDGSAKPLIPNEVVHALIQHFDEHDLSNKNVPSDVLGRAYEFLIKQFADDAGAKAGEFFTPPEVVDTLVRILEPRPGDTVYDPTSGSGGMLVHTADYLREHGHHPTSASYFAQEMNWGNAAIGKINSVLHGLEADIKAGASTITDPQFLEDGRVKKFSMVLANFPFSDEFWWLKPEQQTDDKKKKDKLKKEIFGKEGFKDQYGRFGRGTGFKAPPAGYGDYAFILHILASLTDDGRAGIVCPQGVLFRGQPEVEEETGEFDDYHAYGDAGKVPSLVAEYSGQIRKQIDRREEDEVGRLEAAYQPFADRLACLDNELSSALAAQDAARTRDDKVRTAAAVTRLEKQRARIAGKVTERDDLISDARHRAEDDRNDVTTVGDALIALYAKSGELLKHARVVPLDEIEENEFNLNIPRYVDTFEPEPRIEVQDALKALGDAEGASKTAAETLSQLLKEAGYAE